MAAVLKMPEDILDSRVARLESDVAHIRTDVADIKIDLRQVRGEMGNAFKEVRDKMDGQFRWLVGLLITIVLSVFATTGGIIAAVIHGR